MCEKKKSHVRSLGDKVKDMLIGSRSRILECFSIVDGELHLVKRWGNRQKLGVYRGTHNSGGKGRTAVVFGVHVNIAHLAYFVSTGGETANRIYFRDGDPANCRVDNLIAADEGYCHDCSQVKSPTEMVSSGSSKSLCRDCSKAKNKAQAARNKEKNASGEICREGMKRCPAGGGCGRTLSKTEFYVDRGTRDGLQSICRDCDRAKAVARRAANRRRHEKNGVDRSGTKICPKCKETVSKKRFPKNLGTTDGLSWHCYGCIVCPSDRARGEYPDALLFGELLEHHRGRCAYCDDRVEAGDNLHRDHVYAASLENSSNSIMNFVPSCSSCNHSKKDKTLGEWALELGWGEEEVVDFLEEWLGFAFSQELSDHGVHSVRMAISSLTGHGLISNSLAATVLEKSAGTKKLKLAFDTST